jgi:GR25 family glycosyltransferase involved in LPS biosynthesis
MKTWVINLASRPERFKRAKEQLDTANIPFERFDAIKGGWKGCRDSHLAILEKAKENRWEEDYCSILVLEDDVEFVPNWERIFRNAKFHLPLGWDMLYLGTSPQAPLKIYSEWLYEVKHSLTAHAILYNNRPRGVVDYILSYKEDIKKIDVYYKDVIQEQFKCYVTYPMCATQWQSKSDIAHRSDVSTIVRNFNKFTGNAV